MQFLQVSGGIALRKLSSIGRLIIASAEESADILYGGGFHAPDEFIYYETSSEKGIIVSSLEYSRALKEAKKGIKVIERSELSLLAHGKPFLPFLSRHLGIKKWQVGPKFPFAYAKILAEHNVGIECLEGQPFFPEREVKSRHETNEIKKACALTEEMMMLVRDMIADSKVNSKGILEFAGKTLTSEFIRSEVESRFKKMSYSASRTIIACGRDSAEPHNIGNGPLRAGQPIVADIFPRSDVSGYWGDMTRTFLKGKAPKNIKKAFEAVKDAHEAAKKMIRAGVPAASVHHAALDTLTAAGFPTGKKNDGTPFGFIHGLGHGLGLEIHEQPRVSPLNPRPLAAGNVITVEPGLYDPAWGGIRLEDVVMVTSKSYTCFNKMDMSLEIP